MNTADNYELFTALRRASRLSHLPYGSKLQPVRRCLARLFDQEVMALSRLLACDFAPEGLKQAVIADQPARVAERQASLASAIAYELDRYGCVLLQENPYHQPQIYGASARKVRAA